MSGHLEDIRAIERLGYGPIEAAFLYLVATHSGYFTRNQFLRYAGLKKGCLVHRLTARAISLKHATATEYGRQTLVYHLFSRRIYGAMGNNKDENTNISKHNLRNRRQLSRQLIRTRLLLLDFVLAHPELSYLETEDEKVSYFHDECGIALSSLPSRTYKSLKSDSETVRYFVERFPIFLSGDPPVVPAFLYCDSDLPGLFAFKSYLRSYEDLFRQLPAFRLIYACPVAAKGTQAQRLFTRKFLDPTATDISQLMRYFRIRCLWEGHQTNLLTRADRDCLREGDKRFQGQKFESLYRQWQNGNLTQADLERHFGNAQDGQTRQFETYLLPESYDIFRDVNGASIRPPAESLGLACGLTRESLALAELPESKGTRMTVKAKSNAAKTIAWPGATPFWAQTPRPKSLRASEVAPGHREPVRRLPGLFFAAFSSHFCPSSRANPASTRWQILPVRQAKEISTTKETIMPLLKSPEPPVAKRKYYIRLAEPLALTMERYAEFISAHSVEHVIGQALEFVFRKDADFRAWLEKNSGGQRTEPSVKLEAKGKQETL